MTSPPRPPELPRIARWLVQASVARHAHRDALLGDLIEEHAERVVALGTRRARWWAIREAASIAVRMRSARLDTSTSLHPVRVMESFIGNLRYALRRMLRSPLFTLTAVISLGLGIGANTAIFSLVDAVYLDDPAYPDADRLVDVYLSQPEFSHGTLSYPDFEDLRERSAGVFREVIAMRLSFIQVEDGGRIDMLMGEAVSGHFFESLGIGTAMGRGLSPDDDLAPGAHPVAVLTHSTWVGRYQGDPDIIGRSIRLAGQAYEVVGVTEPWYQGTLKGLQPDLIVPILQYDVLSGSSSNSFESRGSQSMFVKARLADGADLVMAEATLANLSAQLRQEHPDEWTNDEALVFVPTTDVVLNPMIDRYITQASGVLMTVVALVLLIACANLASFLLARASDRRKEIAVRLAMGARRRTLIGQLLTETTLLSAVGGGLGLIGGHAALRALQGVDLPLPIPITLDLALDTEVLLFSVVVSIAAGLLFGLAPAVQATNPALAPTLRDESAGGGRSRGAALRHLLVAGQVGVSVVLLVSAGLFLRSFAAMQDTDLGFDEASAALVQIVTPASRYSEADQIDFWREFKARAGALSGVDVVGLTDNIPLNQLNTQSTSVRFDGMAPTDGSDAFRVDVALADPDYLDALGLRLLAGRWIDASDTDDAQRVVVVNEAFSARFFGSDDAVGRSFERNGAEVTVVGIVANSKVRSIGEPNRPYVLVPLAQSGSEYMHIVARTSGDPEALAAQLVRTAQTIDPEIMILEATTLERHIGSIRVGRALGAQVIGAFAALALLLAAIGLYGVVSYAVSRRAREVGIRLSLGAEPKQVVWMLTGGGMRIVAIGAALGLVASAVLAQALSRLLFGVPALDVATFATVAGLVAVVAFFASWIPARRATRVSPVSALKAD